MANSFQNFSSKLSAQKGSRKSISANCVMIASDPIGDNVRYASGVISLIFFDLISRLPFLFSFFFSFLHSTLPRLSLSQQPHRVSVRSVAATGQSKDAQCCLQVGQNASPAPEQLKATQIGVNSAKLSWVPGDSKLAHSVVVNGREVKTLPPGGYKVQLNREWQANAMI